MKIVGQQDTKERLGKLIDIFVSSEMEIRPHCILTGPSGCGKSFITKSVCVDRKIGFLEINAAQLTKEGTSGNSVSKALTPLLGMGGKPCVVFVDEFDKLFISGNSNSTLAHETTNGVQNEFLKILESDVTSVYHDYGKYANASVSNVVFIFAGAFNGEEEIDIDRLRELGVKTEFLGRVGLVYNIQPLSLEHLNTIIDNSDLLDKYCMLFDGVDREKVALLLKAQVKKNFELNTLGARMINTLIHQYFVEGGFTEKETKSITFQKKLKFKNM